MKIVIENAEDEIKKLVHEMEKFPIAWRSIHFLWSEISAYSLQELSLKLSTILGEDDSYIFKWGEEDVFIISKGTRREPLQEACELVKGLAVEVKYVSRDADFKVTAYDLSISWDSFREFFEFREKEIAKKDTAISEDLHQSIQLKKDEDEIKLVNMDFSEKKIQLQRRTMRPGVTVLAVDSDENTLSLIDSVCKGYKVIRAVNGEEALNRYFDEAPDIVIMDSQLPILDGWSVVKCIYEHDKNAFVIMVTAKTDSHEVQRAIEFGVKGVVKKPFSQGKIEQYLERFDKGAPMHKRVEH